MSRLSAKEKLLYYRTPEVIVKAIARYLFLRVYASTRLLDPCAGTGTALALLAAELKQSHEDAFGTTASRQSSVSTYGIEPELRRSRDAFRCLDHVLQSSFFSTTLSNGDGPDGGWQLLFVNPPYDVDTEIAGSRRSTRLEVSFLQRATTKLLPEGILIWIVPQFVLEPAAKVLAGSYERLTCVRFPDDHWQPDAEKPEYVSLYEQFQQVIVFAQKRRDTLPGDAQTIALISAWAHAGASLSSLPLSGRLSEVPTYYIPNAPSKEIRYFQSGSFDPDMTAGLVVPTVSQPRALTGVWARSDYLAARIPDLDTLEPGIGSPMAPLKNAHLSVLAVAGIANQAVLTGKDGRRVIVKGSMRKVAVYSKLEDEHEIIERTTDTFETALWCIDLDTGGVIRVETGKISGAAFPVEFESMSLPLFLDNFGTSLAQQVTEENPARYTGPASVPWAAQGWQLLHRQPLGKQRDTILATVAGFLQKSGSRESAISRTAPIAEMASGKSFISLCSAFLADRYACGGATMHVPGMQIEHIFPLVILCPPIMARKWKREAEQTLPNVRAVMVKRLGKPPVTDPRKVMERDHDEEGGVSQPTEDLRNFRAFDPTFTGSSLSALGCVDRVVRRIQQELAAWQRAYQQARADGHTPPLKPCHIVIMTTSTAKLGKEWMPIYRMKVARTRDSDTKKIKMLRDDEGNPITVPCCPGCFRMIKDEKRVAQLIKLRGEQTDSVVEATGQRSEVWESEARDHIGGYFTEHDLVGVKDHRVRRFCRECGEALWQYVPARPQVWYPYNVLQPREETLRPLPFPTRQHRPPCLTNTFGRRYPLGDYLHQRYRGVFHLVIADEVHEGADGTALDFARQRLAAACGRMMGLTGTLSNGYSASLFRLLYVLNPAMRKKFGYHDVSKWVDLYGRRQTIQKTSKPKEHEEGYGSVSDRRIGKPIIKELAGFAPHGLAHVLSCSTFLELSDVVPNLPPYREEIREVDLGEIELPYEIFERQTTSVIAGMLAKGDKSALSSWWNGLMTYPNMPYLGWTFTVKRTGETVKAPALPEEMLYPKERALVAYVQQEYDAGRRVLIYTENTGINDIMPRLKQVIETKVRGRHTIPLQVAILRSTTVDPIDREAWLDKQVVSGCDVLICNPKLVKVGLDLSAPRCTITA